MSWNRNTYGARHGRVCNSVGGVVVGYVRAGAGRRLFSM
jgi:hypothetical protein